MSQTTSMIVVQSEWSRLGARGQFQFFATDDEIAELLARSLPDDLGPFSLVGAEEVRDVFRSKLVSFECPAQDFRNCLTGPSEPRHQFFIRSEVLSPDLQVGPSPLVVNLLALNGLVLLQHGFVVHGARQPSSLAVTDRVRNDLTGEIRDYAGYRRVYQALVRAVKRLTCYSTIKQFPDGSEFEDRKHILMTEAAVRAYEQGHVFTRRPGSRVR
jgi:hypothetical protein